MILQKSYWVETKLQGTFSNCYRIGLYSAAAFPMTSRNLQCQGHAAQKATLSAPSCRAYHVSAHTLSSYYNRSIATTTFTGIIVTSLKSAFHDADTDILADILATIVARMSACRSACHRNNFRKSRVSDVRV